MGPYKSGIRRTEFGQEWEWRDSNGLMAGHWKSVNTGPTENLVMIFPPSDTTIDWIIDVCNDEFIDLAGDDAEQRAFAIAAGYVRQYRGPIGMLERRN